MVAALLMLLQDREVRIDFSHPGAPVARVVAALGEAYGEEVRTDESLGRDYVIVAFKRESFESARMLLAKALDATWTEKDDVWRLHRTPEQNRVNQAKERRESVERLEFVRKHVRVPARLGTEEREEFVTRLVRAVAMSDQAELAALEAMSPLTRAMARIKSELDSEFVASLPEGQSVFGSFSSLAVDAMPQKMRQILDEAVADHGEVLKMADARATSLQYPWWLPRLRSARDVLVTVIPNNFGFIGGFLVLTEKGEFTNLNDLGTATSAPATKREWPDSLNVECKFSPETLEFSTLRFPRFEPDSPRVDVSEALLEHFVSPSTHDRHGLAPTEVVFQAALAENVSYVVVPSDNSGGPRFGFRPKWTIKDAVAGLMSLANVEVERTPAYVLISPSRRSMVERQRIDRPAYAQALKAVLERKPLLDPLADAIRGQAGDRALAITFEISLLGRMLPSELNTTEPEVLLLYSELSDQQRSAVKRGQLQFTAQHLSSKAGDALRGLLITKLRNQTGGFVGADSKLPTMEVLATDSLTAARANSSTTFVLRLAQVRMLLQTHRYRGFYTSPYSISPEAIAGMLKNSQDDPNFDLSSPLHHSVSQDTLQLSLLGPRGEVPIAAYTVPAVYEGTEFQPIENLPAWARERFEAEKRRIGNLISRPSQR